jgi:glutathionyl-hydroquinone reductase
MTKTTLTFEELDALLAVLESSDWIYLTELTEADIPALYDKLTEMRDEV